MHEQEPGDNTGVKQGWSWGSTACMLMRMQVRPLLPSRGILWLLQLGMAPCRGHWCLCCAWCSSGGGKRGA